MSKSYIVGGRFATAKNKESFLNTEIVLFNKVSLNEFSIFCTHLAFTVNSGMPLAKCLDSFYHQAPNKRLNKIIGQISKDIQKGCSFSQAAKKHREIPELFVSMVSSGEAADNFPDMLNLMTDYFQKQAAIREKITAALIYPCIVVAVALVVVTILIVSVIPEFADVFQRMNIPLPAFTAALLSVPDFLAKYKFFVLGGLAVFVCVLFNSKHLIRPIIDSLILKIPLVGNANSIILTSNFAYSLYVMFQSNVPLLTSLDVLINNCSNLVFKNKLVRIKNSVSNGCSLSYAVDRTGFFPVTFCNMLATGEESGKMDNALKYAANMYHEQTQQLLFRLSSLVEPFIMCVVGIIVGLIVMGIVQPMYGMYEGIR